jgi:ornithine cyclodeaminase
MSSPMSVRIIDQADTRRLLPMAECIDVMATALTALSRGDAVQPLRGIHWLPDRRGGLGVMPGYLGEPATLGVKVVSVFPGNSETDLESHQGGVLLFDPEDGRLRAIIDAGELTAIRTAAVSGAATRALARRDASILAILGSGAQAHSHLEAMVAVRPVREVRVWSRTPENAARFAQIASAKHGIEITTVVSARDAARGADLICTVTAASEPVLEGAWIAPGAHVNAAGACFPEARELDTAAVVRSRLYVDWRESTVVESGDFLIPRSEGAIGDGHIVAELGEVLAGDAPGRASDDEITVFNSLGVAVEDLAAAHHILIKAERDDVGTTVRIGGGRHETP